MKSFFTLITLCLATSIAEGQVAVEEVLTGDQLITINGLPWAGDNLPFEKVIAVQRDSIDPSIFGRVVYDRHGEDNNIIFKLPFLAPRPGRSVLISGWGSNQYGCFVEVVIQAALSSEQSANPNLDPRILLPKRLEMVISGERITLDAVDPNLAPGASQSFTRDYTYTESSVEHSAKWIMTRHLFPVTASQSSQLIAAPVQDMRMRLLLANGSPLTVPLGSSTIDRWSSVYGYNPSCMQIN